MRECVISMQNTLFSEAVAQALSGTGEFRVEQVLRGAVPRCQFVLLCDENGDPELAQSVKRARQDRLIDAFLYASVTPAYLTAALDAL